MVFPSPRVIEQLVYIGQYYWQTNVYRLFYCVGIKCRRRDRSEGLLGVVGGGMCGGRTASTVIPNPDGADGFENFSGKNAIRQKTQRTVTLT